MDQFLLLFLEFLLFSKLSTGSFKIVPEHQKERLPFAVEKVPDKMCTIH